MLGLIFFCLFSINSAKTIDIVCENLDYFYSKQIVADDVIKYNIISNTLKLKLTDDFIIAQMNSSATLNLTYNNFQKYNFNIFCDKIIINNTMKKYLAGDYLKKMLPIMNVSIPNDIVFTNFGPKTDIISCSSFFRPNTYYWIDMKESCNTFISKNEWDSSIINTKWKKVCHDYNYLNIYDLITIGDKIYGYLYYNIENEYDDDENNLNIIEISKTQFILSIILIVIPFLIIIISLYLIGFNRYKKRPNKNVGNINTEPL